MNGLLLIGILAVIAVLALLLFGLRRPKTADQILGQASPNAPVASAEPAGSRSPGDNGSVRDVVESLVARRSTGALKVVSGQETCWVYLLFGHVYHAQCGTLQGEEAFYRALSWTDASCILDTAMRLPTIESIKRPTRSLLEAPSTDPPPAPPA